MTDKLFGKKKTTMIALAAVVVAAIMVVPAAFAFIGQNTGTGVVGSIYSESGSHSITYKYDAEGSKTMAANYYGIAATEYNPEYWLTYVDEVLSVDGANNGELYNWKGPSETISVPLTASISSTKVTLNYTFTVSDDHLYLNGLDITNLITSVSEVEILTVDCFDYGITNMSNSSKFQWGGHSFLLKPTLIDDGNNRHHVSVTVSASNGGSAASDGTVYSFDFKYSIDTNYYLTINKVFAGWMNGNELVYPGDVVERSVTTLVAKWDYPDVFLNQSLIPNHSDSIQNGKIVSEFNPKNASPFKVANSGSRLDQGPGDNRYAYIDNSQAYEKKDSSFNSGMFRTIYALRDTATVASSKIGTYRSLSAIDPSLSGTKTTITTGAFTLDGDCIFDNIVFNTTSENKLKHGAGTTHTIQANFHILIMGTGIDCTTTIKNFNSAPGILGGKGSGGTTDVLIADKKIVSDSNSEFKDAAPVQLATYVLVHSGVYANAYAGSYNGQIGNGNENGKYYRSTYMVFKGGVVLDSLGAAASGGNSSSTDIWGGQVAPTHYGDLRNEGGKPVTQGGSYIYCIGLKTPGNYYQDLEAGWTGLDGSGCDGVHGIAEANLYRDESAIVHGGSMNRMLYGCAHLFISGKASLFDAQGGGRRAYSATGHTYVEINGKAEVRHIACGTITDGIEDGNSKNCVGGVDIIVAGDATVGTLLGAGYDTYNFSDKSSMVRGDIHVSIMSGTIGYVYGGGFRGSIGTSTANENVNIHIDMYGGTIVNDMFGGGRGGLDKIHNTYTKATNFGYIMGTRGKGSGFSGTTGDSIVHGDIDINLYGGTVEGNVYGGGESLPTAIYYFGWKVTISGSNFDFINPRSNVAVVYGDITVNVDGTNVKGDVYGAGKGIDTTSSAVDVKAVTKDDKQVNLYFYKDTQTISLSNIGSMRTGDSTTTLEMPYYSLIYVYNGSQFVSIPWILPSTGLTGEEDTVGYAVSNNYSDYAKLVGSSTVNIISGVIEGDVYGGGQISVATSSNGSTSVDVSTVNVEGGYVGGNVFGGGYGVVGLDSVKGVTNVNIKAVGTSATTVGYKNGQEYFGMKVLTGNDYTDLSENITTKVNTAYRGATLQTVSYTKAGFSVAAVSGSSNGNTYTYFVLSDGSYTVDCSAMPIVTTGTTATQVLDLITTAMSDYTSSAEDPTLEGLAESMSAGLTERDDSAWGDIWVVGAIVGGSVYGGAENGVTQATKVTVTGGYITSNVFGAGYGASDYVSVIGDVRVSIMKGYVAGNMYGGAAYGQTSSDIYIFITGGQVSGDVYGGGLGRAGKKSTSGNRGIIINDRDKLVDESGNIIKYTVGGNVYGGSSEGNDGVLNSPSNSYIYVQSGTFTDSIFGGGFMGEIYGVTQVWLGYYFDEAHGHVLGGEPGDVEEPAEGVPEDLIYVTDSVYCGGNVREGVTPYSAELVHGSAGLTTEMHINGRYSDIRVGGALMGSGNSCLTGGSTKFKASYFLDPLEMDGIHYFSKVGLFESILHIDGRETYFGGSPTLCSVSHIGALTLQDGSSLFIANLLDDVGSLSSTTRDGTSTTTSSPFNKIVFTSGSTLYIRTMSGNTVTSYGNVSGYTTISVADNAPYGGYILGSKNSTGGFVIMRDGSYSIADKSDFVSDVAGVETHVCCWFISGVESRNLTLTLGMEDAYVRGSVDITKLQSTSQVRYVGGTYISSSDKFDFYRPGLCNDDYFGLMFGFMNGDDDRMLKSDTSHFIGFNSATTAWRDSVYYMQNASTVVEPDHAKGEDAVQNGSAVYWDGYRYSVVDADGRFDLKITDYNASSFNTKKSNLASMLQDTVRVDNRTFKDFSNFTTVFDLDDGKAVYVELEDSYVMYFIMKKGDIVIDCTAEGLRFATKDANNDPVSNSKTVSYVLGLFATALNNASGTKADLATSLETTLEAEGNRAWVKGWDVDSSQSDVKLGFEYMWTSSKVMSPTTLLTGYVSGTSGDTMLPPATFTEQEGQGEYTLNFQFCGANIDTTTYLGYVIIYLQEVNVISYEVSGEVRQDYIVSNRIEVRVDLYAQGKTAESEYELDLYSVDGAGSVDMIIPEGNTNANIYLENWSTDNDSMTQLSFRGTKNVGKTNGWRDTVGSRTVSGTGSGSIAVGTLAGGYMATLNFSVSNYSYSGTTTMTLYFVMKDAQGNYMGYYDEGHEGDPLYFHKYCATVTIHIYERQKIIVTFYDEDQGMGESSGGVRLEVSYGTVLRPSDCPSTADNFLDWYTDRDFYNVYDFSTVITKNISLYARYTYTVKFDYMDGTSSSMYVSSSRDGTPIMKAPKDPTRSGYTFAGWYKQSTCLEPWVFGANGDVVTGNTTLYAKWVGQNVRLVFQYNVDDTIYTLPYVIVPLTELRSGVTPSVSGDDSLFEIALDRSGYSVGDKIIYDVRIGEDKFAAAELTFVDGNGSGWYDGSYDIYTNTKTSYAIPIGSAGNITLVYKGYAMTQDQGVYEKHGVFIGNGLSLTKLTSGVTTPSAGQTNFTIAHSVVSSYSIGDRIVFDIMVNGNVYDAEFVFVEGSENPGTFQFKSGFKQSFELPIGYTGDLTFTVKDYTAAAGDALSVYIGDGVETVTGPYVKYGSSFNVIDVQHSGYLGYEITLLDRAKVMVENELNGEKFIKWVVNYRDADIPVYDDTILDDRIFDLSTATIIDGQPSITLMAITKTVAVEIVMESLTEDVDALVNAGVLDPNWRTSINTTDLSASVRSPSTHLAYPEELSLGANTYLFKFSLNDATRSGWYLASWYNTHVHYQDAMVTDETGTHLANWASPSAGNTVYIKIITTEETVDQKLIVSVAHEYVFTGDATLTGQELEDALADANNWAEVVPNANPVLNDPANPYRIRYVSRWDRIDYNFTVRESGHGVADAYLINSDGTETRGSNFEVHYGDRIKLVYTTESRYEFYKWNYIGECEIEDIYSAETTLIVTGDCIVFASDSGERVVRIYAQFDGGIDHATDSIFLRDAEGEDVELLKSPNVESESYVLYREYALRGTYTMLIKEIINEGQPDESVVEYVIGEIEIGGNQPIFYYEIMSITLQISSEEGSGIYDVGVGNGVESYSKYVGRDKNSLSPVSAFIEISGGYEYLLQEGTLDDEGDYDYKKDINSNVTETMVVKRENFYLTETDASGRAIRGYISPIAYTVTYYVGDDWLHGDDVGKTVTVTNQTRTVYFNGNFNVLQLSDIQLDGEAPAEWSPENPGYQVFGFYGDVTEGSYTIPVNNDTVLNTTLLTSLGDRVVGHNITLYSRIIYNPNSIVITVQITTQNINDDGYTPYGQPIAVDFIEESDNMYHGIHRFATNNGYVLKQSGAVTVVVNDHGTPRTLDPEDYSFNYNSTSGEMSFMISESVVGVYPNALDTSITLKFDRLTTRIYIDSLGGTIDYTGWTEDETLDMYYKVVRYGQTVTIPSVTAPIDYNYEGWTEDGSGSFEISQEGVYTYTVTVADVLAYRDSSTKITVSPVFTPMATVTAIFTTSIGRFRDGSQRISLTLTRNQEIRKAIEAYLYEGQDGRYAPLVENNVGYVFNGWEPTLPYSFASIEGDTATFTASWTAPSHTITFGVDEGSASYLQISATNDSSNSPAESGHSYTHHTGIILTIRTTPGYTIDLESTMAAVVATGTNVGEPVMISENTYRWSFFLDSNVSITMFAKASTVQVHFLVNGKLLENREVVKYQTITFKQYVQAEYPELDGYNCSGEWYTDSECTQVYSDYVIDQETGKRVYSLLVIEETTLYTKVTPNVYYVWFNVNGGTPGAGYLYTEVEVRAAINDWIENGTELPSCIQMFTVGKSLTLNNCEYELGDHIFAGWADSSNGDISYLRKERVTAAPYANYDPESDTGGLITLYAYYLKINNHTGNDGLQNFLYDGTSHSGSISNGTYTGQGESFVFRYSATQITSMDAGTADPSQVSFVDAGTHVVYYYGYVQVGEDETRRQTLAGYFNIVVKAREVTFVSGSITTVHTGNPVVVRTFTWLTGDDIGIVGNEGQGLRGVFAYDATAWPSEVGESDNEFYVEFDGTIIKLSNYVLVGGDNDDGYVFGTITITTASAIIETTTVYDKIYGDEMFNIVATSADSQQFPASGFVYTVLQNSGAVTIEDRQGGGKTVTIVKSGQATVRIFVNQAAADAQTPVDDTYTDVLINVAKKDITVAVSVSDVSSLTKTYDRTTTFNGTLVFTPTGTIQGDNVTFSATAAFNGAGAGDHTIVISNCIFAGEGLGDKYSITSYNTSISGAHINKIQITITSPTAEKFYDGTPLTAPTCVVTGTFAPNEGFSEVKNALGAITNVASGSTTGSVTNSFPAQAYTFNHNTNAANYEVTLVEGTLTIKQTVIQKPTVAGAYRYNMQEQSVEVTPSSSLYELVHDGSTSYSRATNVGSYDVTVRLLGNNANTNVYNVKWNDGTYADITLHWSIVNETIKKNLFNLETNSVVYKGSEWEPALLVDQDPDTHNTYQLGRDYTFTYSNNKDAGTATVTITASANYGSEVFYKTFTITKYEVSVSVSSEAEYIYDGEGKTLVYFHEALLQDAEFGETPELNATNLVITDVGTYESEFYAEFSNGVICDNYIFNIVGTDGEHTFTRVMKQRDAYVIIGSSWKQYDGTALTDHTYTTIGFKPQHLDRLTVTFNPNCTLTGAGTMTNTATVTCQNGNYNIHVIYGTITVIDCSSVTVTVSDEAQRGLSGIESSEDLSRNLVTVVNPSSSTKKDEIQLKALRL